MQRPLVDATAHVDMATTTVPGAHLLHFARASEALGVDSDALLASVGLSRGDLERPATQVALDRFAELVRRAEERCMHPGLALMAGMTMGPTAHGSLGFALMTAPTLADAIALTVRYVPVRSAAFSVEHYEEDGSAVIALHDRLPPGPFRHTVVTVLLMSFWRVSNDITGTTLVGNVDVTFPPPPGMDAFVAPLPGEIRFGQRENRMLFDRAFLDLPLVGADAASHQLAVEQCERERQKQPAGGLVFDVRVRLDASERDYPSLEAMASSLALSASTFKRRLREHGVVYRDLVEEHRRRTAERLLASSSISVEALAARLGYADGPCFARAFRRWTGRSPAEFRRTRSE